MAQGVPQGSVLAPVMFSLYTKDLTLIPKFYGLKIHQFADDIQIYQTGTNMEYQQNNMVNCFKDILHWSKENSLKLNEQKTKFLVISKKALTIDSIRLSNDINFKIETLVKNLGFQVDNNLSFASQINQVCRRGFGLLRNLWNISSNLNDVGLKIRIIKTCLLPQIDYGNGLYVGLPQVQIRKLQRLLNAAVRFIFKIRRFDRVSISSYAKKCHFLPVQYRINYKICTLAYKSINDLAPDYLKDLIQIKSSLECLRINNDKFLLYVPSPEKNML